MYSDLNTFVNRIKLIAGAVILMLLMLSPVLMVDDQRPGKPDETGDYVGSNGSQVRPPENKPVANVQPYLMLDLKRMEMSVRIDGVLLRECAAATIDDSAALKEFTDDWLDNGAEVQTVVRVRLLSGSKTLTNVELEAIAEVTGLGESETQRYIPTEMVIETSSGLRIEIQTDLDGEAISALGGFDETLRRILSAVGGKESLHLKMSGPDAMSIFGVARTMPAIVLKS